MTTHAQIAPSWWPAALAFAITVTLLGFVTAWPIIAAGVLLVAIACGGWIREMLDD